MTETATEATYVRIVPQRCPDCGAPQTAGDRVLGGRVAMCSNSPARYECGRCAGESRTAECFAREQTVLRKHGM